MQRNPQKHPPVHKRESSLLSTSKENLEVNTNNSTKPRKKKCLVETPNNNQHINPYSLECEESINEISDTSK